LVKTSTATCSPPTARTMLPSSGTVAQTASGFPASLAAPARPAGPSTTAPSKTRESQRRLGGATARLSLE
jgi:hypothetical protein